MTKYFYTKYRYIEDNLWTKDTYTTTTTTQHTLHTTHYTTYRTLLHEHTDTGHGTPKGAKF